MDDDLERVWREQLIAGARRLRDGTESIAIVLATISFGIILLSGDFCQSRRRSYPVHSKQRLSSSVRLLVAVWSVVSPVATEAHAIKWASNPLT